MYERDNELLVTDDEDAYSTVLLHPPEVFLCEDNVQK